MFHVNDPKLLKSDHDGSKCYLKPDIVLVSRSDAAATYGDTHICWKDLALKHALKKPKNSKWRAPLSCQELYPEALGDVPMIYQVTENPKEFLRSQSL